MTKTVKPIRAIGAKPTQEELEEQAKRAFYQKRNSLAEIILANALQSGSNIRHTVSGDGTEGLDFRRIVDAAIEAADYFMEKAYSVSIKVTE